MKMIKIFLTLASIILLVGCNKPYTHDYLLQNPDVLQGEFERCSEEVQATPYCNTVKSAAEEFGSWVNLHSANPEEFGRQVLEVQMQLASAKEALQLAQQNNNQDKLSQAQTVYHDLAEKNKILLAVIAATTMQGL